MSITRHHNEWLSLVPNSGPFLSLPVLTQCFPQGLDAHDADHARRLRLAFDEWDENQSSSRPDPAMHRAWIKLVLGETLGFEELLTEGQAIPQTLKSEIAEYGETLRPDWVVNDPAANIARLLVKTYPRSQPLAKPVQASRWKTSPDTRMMQLLHDTGIRLGLVTNGDHWMLVNAPKNETTGYASWYAHLWLEEPLTLRAFRTLLSTDRFFSVPENETIEALLDRSAADQQEVTDQLGYQVRKAVEVLIQALDKADEDHGRKLLAGVDEKVLYEAALTVMMRLVFLFCAEERELLLLGDELYDKNYAVSTLREQLRETADHFGEEILGLRYDAWTRLLTTFRAVYAGIKHDRLKLPAYGGSLFHPDRFPFLEGRKTGTCWRETEATPLPVSNRTVLHLLEALQVLQVRLPGGGAAEARTISFRALDIEQIGHVYEGLLDHTAKRATEPVLGLQGTRAREPEIPLVELEKIAAKGEKELLKFLKEGTGRSESALKKGLNAEIDDQSAGRFRTACQDSQLWKRLKPFAGLVRLDTNGYPVVITPGSIFVTSGADRRSSGTYYTPKSLTEPIIQYTLEPLVYVGPAEGLSKDQWKLRSARELLDLKICDMACGSGAFLVQAARYLSARLLEAWDELEQHAQPGTQQHLFTRRAQNSAIARITPYGMASIGALYEQLVPIDPDERQTYALRIVAQRCLYGVDKNHLAVEMAKLSLWLLTLAKDRPFEFLDHAMRCGDSLVGIRNLDQLRKFNLDGKGEDNQLFLQFLDPEIKEAIALRRQLESIQANTVEDVQAQECLFQESDEKIERLKCAGDLLVAAEFNSGSAADKGAARDDAAIKVAVRFHAGDLPTFRREVQNALNGQPTFHWPLEFPEVIVERGGFDAFMGNPPFLGGTRIRTGLGDRYYEGLRSLWSGGGRADLCAYFFLRAYGLLRCPANFGLLATNSIAQGETHSFGLKNLEDEACSFIRAVPSQKWPGSANLEVALVWGRKGRWTGAFYLADLPAQGINSFLVDSSSISSVTPLLLAENRNKSYLGSYVLGMGFILEPEQAQTLIDRCPKNRQVLFPFLNGEDLNSQVDQTPTRWAISFAEMPLDRPTAPPGYVGKVASDYPLCLEIVERIVKPERLGKSSEVAKFPWWQYWRIRGELYATIRSLPRVLVTSRVSAHHFFSFSSVNYIFSDRLVVIALDDDASFAALSSWIHESWAHRPGATTHETRNTYFPESAFETFPMPLVRIANSAGRNYLATRQQIMLTRQEGLTRTYNRFHDPEETGQDFQTVRKLHVEMDTSVAAAYDWTDLDLGHGFHETKQGIRYTISEAARREVLARLLKLNQERYAEEVAKGLHEKKKPRTTKGKRRLAAEHGPVLFGEK